MVHIQPRQTALLLLAAASLFVSGCLTTIDEACSTIAQNQCDSCFSCGAEVDGVSGAELCDVDVDSRAECEDALAELCEREARTMQDPFGDLDDCEQATTEDTCNALVEREALDRPAAPEDCELFL